MHVALKGHLVPWFLNLYVVLHIFSQLWCNQIDNLLFTMVDSKKSLFRPFALIIKLWNILQYLTDAQFAGVDKERTKHLQHSLSWSHPTGKSGQCSENKSVALFKCI